MHKIYFRRHHGYVLYKSVITATAHELGLCLIDRNPKCNTKKPHMFRTLVLIIAPEGTAKGLNTETNKPKNDFQIGVGFE